MEGFGGPVNLDQYHLAGIDPCLEDCCRREVEGNRRHNALTSTLRRYDVGAAAERRRRHVVTQIPNSSFGPKKTDGREYPALIEYKEKKQREIQENEDEMNEEKEEHKSRNEHYNNSSNNESTVDDVEESNSDDSDDEFDYLLDENFGIENDEVKELEDRRRQELEYKLTMRQLAGYQGYGIQRQLHPKRVLGVAGLGKIPSSSSSPPGVVLHLFDPNSTASASLDYFLEMDFAKKYAGTMFLRSEGRSVLLMNSSLSQKSFPTNVLDADRDLPALIAIRDGLVVDTCPRLIGLASNYDDVIQPHAVQSWLERSGVLFSDPPIADVCMVNPENEAHMDFKAASQQTHVMSQIEEKRYNCGVEGCCKSFAHEHVGIKTAEQSGLVVKEETVLGDDDE